MEDYFVKKSCCDIQNTTSDSGGGYGYGVGNESEDVSKTNKQTTVKENGYLCWRMMRAMQLYKKGFTFTYASCSKSDDCFTTQWNVFKSKTKVGLMWIIIQTHPNSYYVKFKDNTHGNNSTDDEIEFHKITKDDKVDWVDGVIQLRNKEWKFVTKQFELNFLQTNGMLSKIFNYLIFHHPKIAAMEMNSYVDINELQASEGDYQYYNRNTINKYLDKRKLNGVKITHLWGKKGNSGNQYKISDKWRYIFRLSNNNFITYYGAEEDVIKNNYNNLNLDTSR